MHHVYLRVRMLAVDSMLGRRMEMELCELPLFACDGGRSVHNNFSRRACKREMHISNMRLRCRREEALTEILEEHVTSEWKIEGDVLDGLCDARIEYDGALLRPRLARIELGVESMPQQRTCSHTPSSAFLVSLSARPVRRTVCVAVPELGRLDDFFLPAGQVPREDMAVREPRTAEGEGVGGGEEQTSCEETQHDQREWLMWLKKD